MLSDGMHESGGERGIRTLDTGFSPYNGLANRRLQPLGHLSAADCLQFTTQPEGSRLSPVTDGLRLGFLCRWPR